MKTRKKRGLILVGCLAVIAVVMAAAPRERLLLPLSTRLIKAQGWLQEGYSWQSEHSVAIIGSTPLDNRDDSYFPAVLDTVTGKRAPILSAAAGRANLGGRATDFSVSPDGKWFLWRTTKVGRAPSWNVCEVEGRRYAESKPVESELPQLRFWTGAWMPDSRRWVELAGDTKKPFLVIKGVNSGEKDQFIPVHWIPSGPMRTVDLLPNVLGVTRGGHVIATAALPSSATSVELFDFAPVANGSAKKISIMLPPEVLSVDEIILSPGGDRIAWRLQCIRASRFGAWLQKLFHVKNPGFRNTVELWISKSDGSGMQEIGHTEAVPNAQYLDSRHPHSIRWTPDSKKLSYLYMNRLYTVPVE
jgi:hypothetical protein